MGDFMQAIFRQTKSRPPYADPPLTAIAARAQNPKRPARLVLAALGLVVLIGAGIFAWRYLSPQPQSAADTQAFDMARLQYHANTLRGHANELSNAFARSSDPAVRRHTEHLINLLVGKDNPTYGDLDGNGVVEDPGDGTGMFAYLQTLRAQAAAAHQDAAVGKIDHVNTILQKILGECKSILATNASTNISPQINDVQTLSDQVARGRTDSIPEIAQMLHASATQPRVNPELPQSGTTTIDMQQFVFNPKQLKVKKGTTVVFINKDNAKHTVTEDNSAWNSLDINAGKTFSFTFNQPGVIQYHCEYHGDVNGVDMAGTIIVTDD
jgi:plastocyanin